MSSQVHIQAIVFDFSRVLLFPADTGYLSGLNALHTTLSKKPGYRFLDHFRLNTELLDHLNKIKDLPLYIFTSGYVQEAPTAQAAIERIFTAILSADKLGVDKSEPAAYKRLTMEIGADPGVVLFIDDSNANISAAKAAGLQTHHFTGNQELLEYLHDRRLI
jgi:HAD superfamily hydrolase (TIGR01509 family)